MDYFHKHTFVLVLNTLFCHCDRWLYTEAYENIKFFINPLKFEMPASNKYLGSYFFNTDITEFYLLFFATVYSKTTVSFELIDSSIVPFK